MFGDGRQTREFTFVTDIVAANLRAAMVAENGLVLNIGGGSRTVLIHAIRLIEELVGRDAHLKYAERQSGDALDTCANTSRAKELLAFHPEVDLREGLNAQVDWNLTNVLSTAVS